MPIPDSNVVHNQLLGCCLTSKTETEKIRRTWFDRFGKLDAFWVECDPAPEKDEDEFLQTILDRYGQLLVDQGLGLQGKHCILALFLDFTDPECVNRMKDLWKLPNLLSLQFHTNIAMVMEFGYCGRRVAVKARESERAAAAQTVELNNTTVGITPALILVGKPFMGERDYWKDEIILLDAMRRFAAPRQLLPTPPGADNRDDIGYLAYIEYDEKKVAAMKAEEVHLTALMHGKELDELMHLLDERLDVVAKTFENSCPAGKFQPQHPGMLVPADRLFSRPRARAAAGTNQDYNIARDETEAAAKSTIDHFKKRILDTFNTAAAEDAANLENLLDQANVGLAARTPENLKREFEKKKPEDGDVELKLEYKETGAAADLDEYFKSARDAAIRRGKKVYYDALIKRAESITASEDAECDLNGRLKQIKNRLSKIVEPQGICTLVSDGSKDIEGCEFAPTVGEGETAGVVIFREGDQNLENLIEENARFNHITCVKIDPKIAGIAKTDDAPVKGLRITLLNATEAVINSLL